MSQERVNAGPAGATDAPVSGSVGGSVDRAAMVMKRDTDEDLHIIDPEPTTLVGVCGQAAAGWNSVEVRRICSDCLVDSDALNTAYAERNSLVAALAHLFANAAWRGVDPESPDFTVVYIDLPTGQVSWHVPDAEMGQFPPLPLLSPTGWDGHDTPEKYRRLLALQRGDICRDVQDAVERTRREATR